MQISDVEHEQIIDLCPEEDSIEDRLLFKIKTLNEIIWEGKADMPFINGWLTNFTGVDGTEDSRRKEQVHALYLLYHFMYFGSREIRELLHALYRDLYKYPCIENIRRSNSNTTDCTFINEQFHQEQMKTRFLGIGNPSESGTHLLYYFRQENKLSKKLFINEYEVTKFNNDSKEFHLNMPNIRNYVFIDDFIGTGNTAVKYTKDLVKLIKNIDCSVHLSCYSLVATKQGLENIKQSCMFDAVKSVFTLDDSYCCFGQSSRYFTDEKNDYISIDFAQQCCQKYGDRIYPNYPLGYEDMQLLIGFYHNTPNNSLPIFWCNEANQNWNPIFPRYVKSVLWRR